jgi:ABC-type transporter Mla subunit MlaD
VLALSSWTWIVAGALGLVTVGVLIRATLALIGHVKALMRAVSDTSASLNDALADMRTELDRATEDLAAIRRRRGDTDPL